MNVFMCKCVFGPTLTHMGDMWVSLWMKSVISQPASPGPVCTRWHATVSKALPNQEKMASDSNLKGVRQPSPPFYTRCKPCSGTTTGKDINLIEKQEKPKSRCSTKIYNRALCQGLGLRWHATPCCGESWQVFVVLRVSSQTVWLQTKYRVKHCTMTLGTGVAPEWSSKVVVESVHSRYISFSWGKDMGSTGKQRNREDYSSQMFETLR